MSDKKKYRVSFTLQNKLFLKSHCLGINSILLLDGYDCDGTTATVGGGGGGGGGDDRVGLKLMISAGRDSSLRAWRIGKGFEEGEGVEQPTVEHCYAYEHHSDWVNDVLAVGENVILSCSNDSSLKFWSLHPTQDHKITTRFSHHDYVKALASPSSTVAPFIVASAGLDGNVCIWDVDKMTAFAKIPSRDPPESIYSIVMSGKGDMVAVGTSNKTVRLFDVRSRQKIVSLKEHLDNVKGLLTDLDGTLLISGSSDTTIKQWDLRKPNRSSLTLKNIHEDSIWSLAWYTQRGNGFRGSAVRNEGGTSIISGSRDGTISITDLTTGQSDLICSEPAPILKVVLDEARNSVWAATTLSSLNNWSITSKKRRATIHGHPGVIKSCNINNQRQVLTADTQNHVTLWDVCTASVREEYPSTDPLHTITDLPTKAKDLSAKTMCSIPCWFTVDLKTGTPQINLDFPECFNAKIYFDECCFSEESLSEYYIKNNESGKPLEEVEVNLGEKVLQSLFINWFKGWYARVIEGAHKPTNTPTPQPAPPSTTSVTSPADMQSSVTTSTKPPDSTSIDFASSSVLDSRSVSPSAIHSPSLPTDSTQLTDSTCTPPGPPQQESFPPSSQADIPPSTSTTPPESTTSDTPNMPTPTAAPPEGTQSNTIPPTNSVILTQSTVTSPEPVTTPTPSSDPLVESPASPSPSDPTAPLTTPTKPTHPNPLTSSKTSIPSQSPRDDIQLSQPDTHVSPSPSSPRNTKPPSSDSSTQQTHEKDNPSHYQQLFQKKLANPDPAIDALLNPVLPTFNYEFPASSSYPSEYYNNYSYENYYSNYSNYSNYNSNYSNYSNYNSNYNQNHYNQSNQKSYEKEKSHNQSKGHEKESKGTTKAPKVKSTDDAESVRKMKERFECLEPYYRLDGSTPVVISEKNVETGISRVLLRKTVGEFDGSEELPEILARCLKLGEYELRTETRYNLSFTYSPHMKPVFSPGQKRRGVCTRNIRVRHLAAHLVNKVHKLELPQNSSGQTIYPYEYFLLYCKGQLLSPNIDVGTIQLYYWKSSDDILIEYHVNPEYTNIKKE